MDFGPQPMPAGSSPTVTWPGQASSGSSRASTTSLLNVAGSLLGGLGQMTANQGFATYNASSAAAARLAAEEAPKKAAWEITRLRISKRRTLSTQRFFAALAGVQLEGTPMDVMQITEREFLMDEQQIWREGQIEKYTYEEQATAYDKAASAASRSAAISGVGTGIAGAALLFSDARLKENRTLIDPVDALRQVRKLSAYRYTFHGDDRQCIGLLAQEVERVLPQAVQENEIQALIVAALKAL